MDDVNLNLAVKMMQNNLWVGTYIKIVENVFLIQVQLDMEFFLSLLIKGCTTSRENYVIGFMVKIMTEANFQVIEQDPILKITIDSGLLTSRTSYYWMLLLLIASFLKKKLPKWFKVRSLSNNLHVNDLSLSKTNEQYELINLI